MTETQAEYHIVPRTTYYMVFAALLVLLAATIGAAYLDLGELNIVLAMAIAVVKAILIVLYFMHVIYSDRLTWVFAGAALLWFVILIALTMSDYLTRGVLGIDGK